MKRWMLVVSLAVALALVFGTVTYAQGPTGNPTPGTCPFGYEPGQGPGPGAGRGPGTGGGPRGGQPEWAGMEDEVTTLLGMTEEQIQAERQAGKSLVQIAASKGVSEQALVTAILTAKKADLDAQVAAGRLTQDRADAMYARMQTQVAVAVNRTTTGPRQGQPGLGQGQGQMNGPRAGQGQGQPGQGQGQGQGLGQGQMNGPRAGQGQPPAGAPRQGTSGMVPRWGR